MVYQRAHAYFCPDIYDFVETEMDIPPATVLGRVRRSIQIIFQKSRPYLEHKFKYPIAGASIDEVQLFTVASGLQRIHDSAPNSQDSEALFWLCGRLRVAWTLALHHYSTCLTGFFG
jgi:hypothetical protein